MSKSLLDTWDDISKIKGFDTTDALYGAKKPKIVKPTANDSFRSFNDDCDGSFSKAAEGKSNTSPRTLSVLFQEATNPSRKGAYAIAKPMTFDMNV